MDEEQKELLKQFKEWLDLDESWNNWIDMFFEKNPNFSDLDGMFYLFQNELQPSINELANHILNQQLGGLK